MHMRGKLGIDIAYAAISSLARRISFVLSNKRGVEAGRGAAAEADSSILCTRIYIAWRLQITLEYPNLHVHLNPPGFLGGSP